MVIRRSSSKFRRINISDTESGEYPMSTDPKLPSTKIIPFPAKSTLHRGISMNRPEKGGVVGSSRSVCVEFGGGWYHEAAIDADRPRRGGPTFSSP